MPQKSAHWNDNISLFDGILLIFLLATFNYIGSEAVHRWKQN